MLLGVGIALFMAGQGVAQSLQDFFTNRVTITTLTGQIVQNNSTATVEVNEPKHGGKTGGHSLWISWIAATNGVVTFKTETSGFDTLLSAYQFTTNGGTTFAELREVARADDSEGLDHESAVDFGVRAGEQYEIAVDGYFGAVGTVDFQWEFRTLANEPPQILNTLADRAVNIGDAVTLAFNVTNINSGDYQWFRDANEIHNATTPSLTISNFSATNVGRYKLRVDKGGGGGGGNYQFFSMPVEVQINTEGLADTLAQSKVLDASATPLIGSVGGGSGLRPGRLAAGTVRGYNGSQIFNTTFALVDTNEPPHCDVASSKSYWLIYQPPTNGTLTLDTLGSTYDTVMEAYTYNGVLTGYSNLISLDCANDSFSSNTASLIVLPVIRSRQYLLVVAGVNGASGTAWLNYNLNTNQLPPPPTLTGAPAPQTVVTGSTVVLTAPVTGAPPMFFSWTRNGVPIPGANGDTLVLSGLTAQQSGNYSFTVTNDLGSVTGTFTIKALVPPWCKLTPIPSGLQLSFPTQTGQTYSVEEALHLPGDWNAWPGSFVGNGLTNYFNLPNAGGKFYRIRTE